MIYVDEFIHLLLLHHAHPPRGGGGHTHTTWVFPPHVLASHQPWCVWEVGRGGLLLLCKMNIDGAMKKMKVDKL